MLLARSLVPDVSLKRGERRTSERDAVIGLAPFADVGTVSQGRQCTAPLGAWHQVHTRILRVVQEHDRREPVARRLESPLGPENVAAHSLSRYEHLDRAAGRSLLSVP
jgi:hypothetical protein